MTGAVVDEAEVALRPLVLSALKSVDDPEYPGVSIVDLGLVETISCDVDGRVFVGLIPTFSGCPALDMIAGDVQAAVEAVSGVGSVTVEWLRGETWSVERLSEVARHALNDQFTVAVQIGNEPVRCPRCGSVTEHQSMFGPSRCRAIHRCQTCREAVEVMRK